MSVGCRTLKLGLPYMMRFLTRVYPRHKHTCHARMCAQFIRCCASASSAGYESRGLPVSPVDSADPPEWSERLQLPEPEFDFAHLTAPANTEELRRNILNRKGVGDIDKVIQLWKDFKDEKRASKKEALWRELLLAAAALPNSTHPDSPIGDESNAVTVSVIGNKRVFDFKPKSVTQLGENLGLLRTFNVGLGTGERSYYLCEDLARLERALCSFALDRLFHKGFKLVSVPELLDPSIIEGCGFKTTGERTQVYRLDTDKHGLDNNFCLAGTAEMPLAGYCMGEKFDDKDLPLRLCAVSRCYRAETSELQEEKGIYRVHQFTKVEMFGVTAAESGTESEELLQELVSIEKSLFSELGLHCRVLNMPSQELGAPAYQKFDMETWMPAKGFWGEISSASNCTDFQSRRLSIHYQDSRGKVKHAHTVNGTACAIPRMIMALMENYQNEDGSVELPVALQSYMGGKSQLQPSSLNSSLHWIKRKKITKKKR